MRNEFNFSEKKGLDKAVNDEYSNYLELWKEWAKEGGKSCGSSFYNESDKFKFFRLARDIHRETLRHVIREGVDRVLVLDALLAVSNIISDLDCDNLRAEFKLKDSVLV
jgi:hypothetical protein